MTKIRKIEIRNFRGIHELDWFPSAGINCLIGPGDTGKSTVLDAIDLCLGARRNISIADSDFYNLDVEKPISITLTLGSLDSELLNIDAYGIFLRGMDSTMGVVEDEPRRGLETVLSVNLTVRSDLEPAWALQSNRATKQGLERSLSWKDRQKLSPHALALSRSKISPGNAAAYFTASLTNAPTRRQPWSKQAAMPDASLARRRTNI